MSLNAPASPKRLSALEMTFPSLENCRHPDSDEDADVGISKSHQGMRLRHFRHPSPDRGESASDLSDEPSSGSQSPSRRHTHRRHQRHSSFVEHGNKPAPTSLAILAGLISGATRMIDYAYAEQGIPVPDIDDPGLPKSRFAKEPTDLKISTATYKAIEVCIEACHQLVGIVQRPEVTCAEAAYAVRSQLCSFTSFLNIAY